MPHGPHFLHTHQTGSEESGLAALTRKLNHCSPAVGWKRMAWVVASQTEDSPPDGDAPANLDGALVVAGSLVLLSLD